MKYSLLLLFCCLSLASLLRSPAEEEEKGGFPPLGDWAEVEDITDKVLAWDEPFAEVVEYSLTDPDIPELANPHPMCIAPAEYDSYDHGKRMFPKQCGYDKGNVNAKGGLDLFKEQWRAYNSPRPWAYYDQTKNRPRGDETEYIEPYYETIAVKEALSKYTDSLPLRRREIALDRRHFAVLVFKEQDIYGEMLVESVFDVRVGVDGTLKSVEIELLRGSDYIAGYYCSLEADLTGTVVFLKEDRKIVLLQPNGVTAEHEFTMGNKYGEGIWGPLSFLCGSPHMYISTRAFPVLPFAERNYGVRRGLKLPPIKKVHAGDITYDDYSERNAVVDKEHRDPENKKSRIVLFDLLTGRVIHDLDGVHDIQLIGPDDYVIPQVALNGQWVLTGIDRSKVLYNLPLSKIIPADVQMIRFKQNRMMLMYSSSSVIKVDFIERKMWKCTYKNEIDNTIFQNSHRIMYMTCQFVSLPFDYDGKPARRIWIVDRDNLEIKLSFVIEDVFEKGTVFAGSPLLYPDNTIIIFTGSKYCKIIYGKAGGK